MVIYVEGTNRAALVRSYTCRGRYWRFGRHCRAGPAWTAVCRGASDHHRLPVDHVISQRRRAVVQDERRDLRDLGFARPKAHEAGILVAVGVLVLLVSWVALGARWWRAGFVGEWATYMVLAYTVLSWRPFRSVAARIGRAQKAAILACLMLLAIGQFIGGGRQTFPFVRFAMFTDAGPQEARYYTYLGVSKAGRSIQLDPVALYPSLDRGRFDGRLFGAAEAAIAAGPGSDAARAYDDLLLALLERHNLSAGDPLVRLDVYLVDAPLEPLPRHRTGVRAQRVWSVEAR
jgi:hypothetical protein